MKRRRSGLPWSRFQPKGPRHPLFLVHGAGGNVLLYGALAKHLEPDYPLYGLQSQGLDGQSKPLETIEEMADHYLQEIRTVQPKGPVLLAAIAWEARWPMKWPSGS